MGFPREVAYFPREFKDPHGNTMGIMHSPREVSGISWEIHHFPKTSRGILKFPMGSQQIPMGFFPFSREIAKFPMEVTNPHKILFCDYIL